MEGKPIFALAALALLMLVGCTQPGGNVPVEKRCVQDSDCACGKDAAGECFYGNINYVNVEEQCPDFCNGIAAMFETRCVEYECTQVRVS